MSAAQVAPEASDRATNDGVIPSWRPISVNLPWPPKLSWTRSPSISDLARALSASARRNASTARLSAVRPGAHPGRSRRCPSTATRCSMMSGIGGQPEERRGGAAHDLRDVVLVKERRSCPAGRPFRGRTRPTGGCGNCRRSFAGRSGGRSRRALVGRRPPRRRGRSTSAGQAGSRVMSRFHCESSSQAWYGCQFGDQDGLFAPGGVARVREGRCGVPERRSARHRCRSGGRNVGCMG